MNHPVYRILGFKLVGPHSLHVQFGDGIERRVDLEAVLEGEVFGSLKDPRLFEKVDLDPERHTLVWPNGADFDPATLHDWPKYLKEIKVLAEKWSLETA